MIKLPPGCEHTHMHVVDQYKHLGGLVAPSADLAPEVRARASSALAAFAPISHRVFGCPSIHRSLRLFFMDALILSRLLYNAHTWVVKPKVLKILNGPYMRALRRIDDPCATTAATR